MVLREPTQPAGHGERLGKRIHGFRKAIETLLVKAQCTDPSVIKPNHRAFIEHLFVASSAVAAEDTKLNQSLSLPWRPTARKGRGHRHWSL